MSSVVAVILAAGKGTRMKSDLPKGLHQVCGIPMVSLIGRAILEAGIQRRIAVIGHGGELMQQVLGDGYEFAWQHEQRGTGHAAQMALPLLEAFEGTVIISPGDTPLLESKVFAELVQTHEANGNACTLATSFLENPHGYGRVIRDSEGLADRIVEHKDCTPEERQTKEVNAAIYCFQACALREALAQIDDNNAQGELYLTDVIGILRKKGLRVEPLAFQDPGVLMGVNDRWQLAQAAKILRERIIRKHAENGVTIVDPDTTFIELDVEIAPDATIEPNTILEGATKIGAHSVIGPNTKIKNSTIGENCTVLMSHLNKATMHDHSRCGPFANLRPGAVLHCNAKIGNFVEIKNASVGESAAVSHLSYIGDGCVGNRANIGAGTIFCNYDGFNKNRTEVGDDAFVGSNSTLIAPVTVGEGAFVAAGSTINKPVPAGALALGRARQEVKEEWAIHWRRRKQGETSK